MKILSEEFVRLNELAGTTEQDKPSVLDSFKTTGTDPIKIADSIKGVVSAIPPETQKEISNKVKGKYKSGMVESAKVFLFDQIVDSMFDDRVLKSLINPTPGSTVKAIANKISPFNTSIKNKLKSLPPKTKSIVLDTIINLIPGGIEIKAAIKTAEVIGI